MTVAGRRERRPAFGRAVVAGSAALALFLSSCGQDPEDIEAGSGLAGTSITFNISVSDEEKPAIQELLSRFENRTKAPVNLERLSRFRRQRGSGST